jgi:hypothetical protein
VNARANCRLASPSQQPSGRLHSYNKSPPQDTKQPQTQGAQGVVGAQPQASGTPLILTTEAASTTAREQPHQSVYPPTTKPLRSDALYVPAQLNTHNDMSITHGLTCSGVNDSGEGNGQDDRRPSADLQRAQYEDDADFLNLLAEGKPRKLRTSVLC